MRQRLWLSLSLLQHLWLWQPMPRQ
jgi:hypothetical protein